MVKSIISMLFVAIILIFGAFYESNFIKRQFLEFDIVVETLYDKVNNKTATEDDALAVQKNWLDKKRVLHIFIPHNEIKEFDLWIAESVKLIRDKKWEDAISKVEVIRELSEQVPKTFIVSLENIL